MEETANWHREQYGQRIHEVQLENHIGKGKKRYLTQKRAFDVVLSAVSLLLLFVPMIMIGIVVRLDSPGPALFRQERLGLNGKPFMMYKFRSMRMDAEKKGPQWAEREDSRCTRVGRFLRKTRLDELPQLFNILKGDMSFVGPRPERAYFYRKFSEFIPDFGKRLSAMPGLTGWAQVNGGYELEPEEKLRYDLEYIKKRSMKMDLLCILMTVRVVITGKGAR